MQIFKMEKTATGRRQIAYACQEDGNREILLKNPRKTLAGWS
jgi:hypothetical protein